MAMNKISPEITTVFDMVNCLSEEIFNSVNLYERTAPPRLNLFSKSDFFNAILRYVDKNFSAETICGEYKGIDKCVLKNGLY